MNNLKSVRYSIIIPAYNEERYLPRLLGSIAAARSNYHGGEVEIIVADNCSTDRTAEIARDFGCRVVEVEKRVIGAARNGGARAARGEIFCFIDADSAIHPRTFEKLDEAIAEGRYVGGATGVYLERRSPGIILMFCLLTPFAWLTGFDTGLVFCRREDFEAIGGYDEDLLVAEDVCFLLALKRRGRAKRQTLVRLTKVRALGSTRKFDQYGDWHYFPLLARLLRRLPALLTMLIARGRLRSDRDTLGEVIDYWYRPSR